MAMMTRDDLAVRLDALSDEELIDLLSDLEHGTDADIPTRGVKIAVTVEVIQRRPFAAWLCLSDGDPVTASAAAWAYAREALFGPLAGEAV